jgi:hypothetical protein
MIEINLIPDVKQELIRAERVRSVVITSSILISIASVGIVALLAGYVFGVQTVRGAIDDDAIKKGAAELASVEDLSKILTIQNQLDKIGEIDDQKKIDSRVFEMLLAIIPPAPNNVQVSNLLIEADDSSLTIEGFTPTYDSLEVFRKTIDGAVVRYIVDGQETDVKLATDISTSDVSFGEDATGNKVLRFTLSFTYPEELFSPTVPGIVIKLTNQGNVTDSYLGIPKSIFAEEPTTGEGDEQ